MALDTDRMKARVFATLKGFSPSQLVIIGLLSVLGVTGGVFFLRWVSTPTYGVLLAGLDPKDAAAVTAKLGTDGVPYKLSGGGSTVLVPQSSLDKERLSVAAAGLPAGSTQDGWAAFDKQGLTSSSFQQQVAYQRALEATLSSTLQGITGIRSAQVHLALPEKRLFSENQDAARASVLVQTSGTPTSDTVDAMTHLVSSAVAGMDPKDVSITDANGTLLTGSTGPAGSTRGDTARRSYEDAMTAQVGSMFDTLLGPGHAVVRVNAVMDTSNTTIDSQVYDPKKTAVLGSTSSSETYATAPGATTTGGPITTPTATGAVPTTTSTTVTGNGYKKVDAAVTNGVSLTTSHEVLAPGGIKRLTVAVAVDRNAKNIPTTADITAMVGAAVGLDPKRGDSLAVTTPSFLASSTPTVATTPTKAGPADMVATYGPRGLGALLLLLVGLGFLRTLKRAASVEIPADQVTAALGTASRSAVGARTTAALPPGTLPAPRAKKDGELMSMVDESPDEVAALLRGWLAGVGGSDQ